MLVELTISNLKLVKKAHLEFSPGLNMITGESGTGKSMLMSALFLILGQRASADCIFGTEDKATVEAVFQLNQSNRTLMRLLEEHGIEGEDNELIIRREVLKNGRSRIYANGLLINLNSLKAISAELMDLHSQHEHQSLLSESTHLSLLDRFLDLGPVLEEYQNVFQEYCQLKNEYEKLILQKDSQSSDLDFWRFQLQELNKLDLTIKDLEELKNERSRLRNFEKIKNVFEDCLQQFEVPDNLIDRIRVICQRIDQLKGTGPEYNLLSEQAESALDSLQEVYQELVQKSFEETVQENKLDELEGRLYAYEDMQRKYRCDLEGLVRLKNDLEKRIDQVDHFDDHMKELKQALWKKEEYLDGLAQQLHQKRSVGAKKLEKMITHELQDLEMGQAQLKIAMELREFSLQGKDRVSLYISTNKGKALAPLIEIASGGELSRVMLALKTVFSKVDPMGTLVFDEVDANLGGQIALSVGSKLQELASSKQVLCVTHLAQIAAKANRHFAVSKTVHEGLTISQVKKLSKPERIKELARMLSGELSKTALKHAEELIAS